MNQDIRQRANYLSALFVRKYIDVLSRIRPLDYRTYGVEYEFLSTRPMSLDDMDRLYQFMPHLGMHADGSEFSGPNGIRISFEPGGQIEYSSPPLRASDSAGMETFLSFIEYANALIGDRLHIVYEARGYIPGRADSPLLLTMPRYRMLHERLAHTGSRGLEMMKGTASVHLHVNISGIDELLLIFYRLCDMSVSTEFCMSPQRRDIWDNTDPMRCGLPPCCRERLDSAQQLIERLIGFALAAEVLGENVVFPLARDQSFEAFLYHMTTLFTDVRFNLKGPTLELRTLDSMPTRLFKSKWDGFISNLETL